MTREEAIEVLAMFLHKQCDLERTEFAYDANTVWHAVYMASNALEQESCDDAVSRQVVKEQMLKYGFHAPDMTVTEFVEDLPPVLPKREQGEWIEQSSNKEQGEREHIWWKCSQCGQVIFSETERDRKEFHAFCSKCGAEMVIKSCSTCKHDGELVCATHGCHNKERYEEK